MSFPRVPEIDVHELARKLQSGEAFVLLDVREAWELDHALINDSRLKVVPTSRLAQLGAEALPVDVQSKDAEILVMCHHGVRSANVTEWMRARGWTNVFSVRGGISEYARVVDGSIGKY
ncbi:MAG: rhodanese-like domain-containing protein [Anaerolineales bacterium]|jgi:rhodanese-related sulfurtransferase